MYTVLENLPGLPAQIVQKLSDESSFPMITSNAEYEQFLDDINEQGTNIVDGDIPEHVLAEAAAKNSKQQIKKYADAVDRLSQYILSEGRPEIKQMLPTGERVFNQTTNEIDDVLVEVTTQYPVDPVPLTIEVSELNKATMEMTFTTVDNPVVVRDLAERAAAQAIQAATPPDVVTAYENSLKT
jgi:hypothetical protein